MKINIVLVVCLLAAAPRTNAATPDGGTEPVVSDAERGVDTDKVSVLPDESEGQPRNGDRARGSSERPKQVWRIVNGKESQPGRWPFSVAITYVDQNGTLTQYCGGSLISKNAILTAAHCKVSVGDYAVIGRHDLSKKTGKALRISAVVAHPEYDPNTYKNDIAILTIGKSSSISSYVRLAAANMALSDGQSVTAIGWGRTKPSGPTSPILREASMPVTSQETCRSQYGKKGYVIGDSMMCAADPGVKDTCQGDSGGPLMVVNGDGSAIQVGITSFGIGCANWDYAGVYTRVSSYSDWIAANLPL